MVHPGAFRGLRKDFLLGEKSRYSDGVAGGFASDALAVIQRKYFKRFPVDLPHNEDPTEEFLASVNDQDPDSEVEAPDAEQLSPAEYEAAMKKFEERAATIRYRKAQIKRWMAYQHSKDKDVDPMEPGADNPYRVLMHKLTGVSITRPRQRSAVNTWRKTQREEIEVEVRKQVKKVGGVHGDKLAAFRDKIAKAAYAKLSDEEKKHWEEQAKVEQVERLAQWQRDLDSPPSTEPADRQRVILGLAAFFQPILDLACEAAGWKATLIMGGPEPAHKGHLNILSVHSGTTSGDLKLTFGRAERLRFKKHYVPIFGSFLQMCYTPEECRQRALPADEGYDQLKEADLESGCVDFDTVELGTSPSDLDQLSPTPQTPQAAREGLKVEPVPQNAPSSIDGADATPAPPNPPTAVGRPTPLSPNATPDSFRAPPGQADAASPSASSKPQDTEALGSRSRPPTPDPSPQASPVRGVTHSTLASPSAALLSPRALPPRQNESPSPIEATAGVAHAAGAGSAEGNKQATAAVGDALATSQGDPCLKRPAEPAAAAGSPPKRPCVHVTQPTPAASIAPPPSTHSNDPNASTTSANRPAPASKRKLNADDATNPAPKRTRSKKTAAPEVVKPAPKAKIRPTPIFRSTSTNMPTSSIPRPWVVAPEASTTGHKTTSVESVSAPADAPKWFVDALRMFQANVLDDSWTELLRVWAAFEAQNGYAGSGKLTTTHRPAVVNNWIKRARLPVWRPAIPDLDKYANDFSQWWFALQPLWRQSDDGTVAFSVVEGDWTDLRRAGVNGFLSVLAALFYWRLAAEREVDKQRWSTAVADCCVVLNSLNIS